MTTHQMPTVPASISDRQHGRSATRVRAALRWSGVQAGMAALLLGLAGCAGQPTPAATPELSLPAPSATPSAGTASPTKDEQVAAGSEAIRAYRQMIFDLFADHSRSVTEMKKVATGKLLQDDMQRILSDREDGWVNTQGAVALRWVKPVSLRSKEMRLYACVDPGGILTGRSEPSQSARAEAVDYVLTKPSSDWVVEGIYTHASSEGLSC